MLAPSTLSERSTAGATAAAARQPDYQSATAAAAVAAAAVSYQDDGAYGLDLHLQQQQLAAQQQQQQQLAYQQQQQAAQHSIQQHLHAQQQHHAAAQAAAAAVQHQQQHPLQQHDFSDEGELLRSKFVENEIVKTFSSKPALVGFVKNVLCIEEQCKIVINSLKPKAIYFQCERSGLFRTTVKDLAKRQRVAYTKRNKCGYRLVANLYPPEKDKKRQPPVASKKLEDDDDKVGFERNMDDKLSEYDTGEMWILRMINPVHNHAPEPNANGLKERKRRLRFSRRLVEKPIINNSSYNPDLHHSIKPELSHLHQQQQHQQQLAHHHQQQQQLAHHHHQLQHDPTPLVQDPAVIAAIELAPATAAAAISHLQHHTPVDPNIDPNVDPSVQEHDHSHR
jgi:hypothetical protein